MVSAGGVWTPPGKPPGSLVRGFSLSVEAIGGVPKSLGESRPVRAWVQFVDFCWRVDAVAVAATADAVLVEWVWLGQRQEAWVWRAAVKHRAARAPELTTT